MARKDINMEVAQAYGFPDEELDFIITYDIKYRMGREEESAEEASSDSSHPQRIVD